MLVSSHSVSAGARQLELMVKSALHTGLNATASSWRRPPRVRDSLMALEEMLHMSG